MLEVFLRTGLYHSFRLPDGRVLQGTLTLEQLEARLKAFGLPDDLTGKRVLDIGPWDGYFTFEMERRGAEVVAIDYVDLDTFRELHRAFDSQAEYHRMDVYELEPHKFGMFDIVLCLGVLYHLKHPLLALEKICAITREICVVDSFVCDGEEYLDGQRPHLPYIEFYENDQLAGQLDNWCGPSVTAVEALVRAAGFARARLQRVTERTAIVAADRKWGALPVSEPPLELVGLHCHAHGGKYFQSQKEEYFAILCRWSQPEAPPLETVFPEVDQYGVAPLACKLTPAGLAVSARVPPGLTPGEHTVRLKIGSSGWSDPI
ncbi:MAG TPA: methyltransferase domain-containing protein, partial [Bryobacteraceae bacterium]|nr:methyltransferase domain-containing protein [Bryobacteraceae bacterium]